MAYIKIIEEKFGGHHHIKIFTAVKQGLTMAKCGDVVFDEREMPEVRPRLREFADAYEINLKKQGE